MRFLEYLQEKYMDTIVDRVRAAGRGLMDYGFAIYLNPSTSEIRELRMELGETFGNFYCRFIIDMKRENFWLWGGELLHNDMSLKYKLFDDIIRGSGRLTPQGKIDKYEPDFVSELSDFKFCWKYFK